MTSSRAGACRADQLGTGGALAGDVELDPLGAHQPAVLLLVAARRRAGAAAACSMAATSVGARLHDLERRERAVVVDGELGAQRVDAGGLEPELRPVAEVAAGRALQRAQQVGEGGVAVGVLGEVLAQPGEEGLHADVRGRAA